MAVDQPKYDIHQSRKRRILVGTNVAVMTAAAIGVLAVVNWIGQRTSISADLTASGLNSVSDRTIQLVKGLDQTVYLTSFYTVTDLSKGEQRFLDRVQSLFRLYQRENPSTIEFDNVNLIKERDKAAKLVDRLKEKYAPESVKHEAAIESGLALIDELSGQFDEDVRSFEALLNSNPNLADDQTFGVVIGQFPELVENLRELPGLIKRQKESGDVPRYDSAASLLKNEYKTFQGWMPQVASWLRASAESLPGLSETAKTSFEQMAARYDTIITRVEAASKDVDELPDLELVEILDKIKQRSGNILVETNTKAKVVAFDDVWKRRNMSAARAGESENADVDRQYSFHGEAAVSSAVLHLIKSEKTAVIFVRHGGSSPITGGFMPPMGFSRPDYGVVAERLRNANFVVQDWDLATQGTPPSTVEDISRRIFVLLKPEASRPNPQMPQVPPGQFDPGKAAAVSNAIGESGRVLFHAGFSQPDRQMPFPVSAQYAWGEYLNRWGIRCKDQNLIIRAFNESPNRWVSATSALQNGIADQMLALTDHPIAEGVFGLNIAIISAAPLEIIEPGPTGYTVEPILETKKSGDVWAVEDMLKLQSELQSGAFRKYENDHFSPHVVAAAVANDKGGKAIVVSSFDFAKDALLRSRPILAGGTLRMSEPLPGNLELFLNSIFWLNDNENQIGAGPRESPVRLIKGMKEWQLTGARWGAWGVWPFALAIFGIVICFVRRR
jgi:hypothetical protein